MNYYNEIDPRAAAWLRELIKDKLIPEGTVDERSITEVQPADLGGYTQCHFFAGVGGWSLALQLAGWPSDRPVWTGSCPCQPFSKGGNSEGAGDRRHLWPAFFELIKKCKPVCVFGEQVERAIKFQWLDGIQADLESENYTVGAAVLGAHSKALPHVRQRLYWLAHSNRECDSRKDMPKRRRKGSIPSIWQSEEIKQEGQARVNELVARCIAQRVSSYSQALSLLDGIPGYMALMRGAGNAIVPQVAATFIQAYLEARGG